MGLTGAGVEYLDFCAGGLKVILERKPIKNIYLRVKRASDSQFYLHVSAPRKCSVKHLRELVEAKQPWIDGQVARRSALPAPVEFGYDDGEEHLFLGKVYQLKIVAAKGAGRVLLSDFLEIHAPLGSGAQYRRNLLFRWYAAEFTRVVDSMFAAWQGRMGVRADEWRARRMKSRWGSCNVVSRRVWLNLELVKKPFPCIEYVLVHELAHLVERGHGPRFWAVVERQLPDWKERRSLLNELPPHGLV